MDSMKNKTLEGNPKMRNLLMEIFHTDNEEELRKIALKAQKYEQMFQNKPSVNLRNAGRKSRFTDKDIVAIEDMFVQGISIQDIASHFQTSRQTISKYITPAKRMNKNKLKNRS